MVNDGNNIHDENLEAIGQAVNGMDKLASVIDGQKASKAEKEKEDNKTDSDTGNNDSPEITSENNSNVNDESGVDDLNVPEDDNDMGEEGDNDRDNGSELGDGELSDSHQLKDDELPQENESDPDLEEEGESDPDSNEESESDVSGPGGGESLQSQGINDSGSEDDNISPGEGDSDNSVSEGFDDDSNDGKKKKESEEEDDQPKEGSEGGDSAFAKYGAAFNKYQQLSNPDIEDLAKTKMKKMALAKLGAIGISSIILGIGVTLIVVFLFVLIVGVISNIVNYDHVQAAVRDLERQKRSGDIDVTVDESYEEVVSIVETGVYKAYKLKRDAYTAFVRNNSLTHNVYESNLDLYAGDLEMKVNEDNGLEYPIFRKKDDGKGFIGLNPTDSSFNSERSDASFVDATNRKAYSEKIARIAADYSTSMGGATPRKGNDKALLDIVNNDFVIKEMFNLNTNKLETEKTRYGYEYYMKEELRDVSKTQTFNRKLYLTNNYSGDYRLAKDHEGKSGYRYVGKNNGNLEFKNIDQTKITKLTGYLIVRAYEEEDDNFVFEDIYKRTYNNKHQLYEYKPVSIEYFIKSYKDPESDEEFSISKPLSEKHKEKVDIITEEPYMVEHVTDELIAYKYTEYSTTGTLVDGKPNVVSDFLYTSEIHDESSPVVWNSNFSIKKDASYSDREALANKIRKSDYFEFNLNHVYDMDTSVKTDQDFEIGLRNYEKYLRELESDKSSNVKIKKDNNPTFGSEFFAAEEQEAEVSVTLGEYMKNNYKDLNDKGLSRVSESYKENPGQFMYSFNNYKSAHPESGGCPIYGSTEVSPCGHTVKYVKDPDKAWWKFWAKSVPEVTFIKSDSALTTESDEIDSAGKVSTTAKKMTFQDQSDISYEEILFGIEAAEAGARKAVTGDGSATMVQLAQSENSENVFSGVRYFQDLKDGGVLGWRADGVDWCAYFIQWLFMKSGYGEDRDILPADGVSGRVLTMRDAYDKIGRWHPINSDPNYIPVPGDLLVVSWQPGYDRTDHIALVTEYHADTDEVVNISGNTESPSAGKPLEMYPRGSSPSPSLFSGNDYSKLLPNKYYYGHVMEKTFTRHQQGPIFWVNGYINPAYPDSSQISMLLAELVEAASDNRYDTAKPGLASTVKFGIIGFSGEDLNNLIKAMYSMDTEAFTSLALKHKDVGAELINIGKGKSVTKIAYTEGSAMQKALQDLGRAKWAQSSQHTEAAKVMGVLEKTTSTTLNGFKSTGEKMRLSILASDYLIGSAQTQRLAAYKLAVLESAKFEKDKDYARWFEHYISKDFDNTLDREVVDYIPPPTGGLVEHYEYEERGDGTFWKIRLAYRDYRQSKPKITNEQYAIFQRINSTMSKYTEEDLKAMIAEDNEKEPDSD